MAEYVEPPGFSRAEAFGPWLVGMAVDGALLGAVLSLTIEYYRFYHEDDGRRVKIMVAVAAVANVLKSIVLYANMWFKLVDGWGNFTVAFTYVPWFVSLDPLWSVLICMLAQSFFLMRLQSFLKGTLVAIPIIIVIVLFMLLEFAGNIVMSVQTFSLKSQAEIARFKKADIVNTVGQLSTDILIATCLCVALLKAKTGVAKTDGLVKKLIVLSFTTAFIPATNNIVKSGLYHAYYFRSSSFIVFSIMQPKLYHLAMLVTLNIRQTLRRGSSHASGPSASYEMSRQGVASVSRGNRHPSRRVSENFKTSHVGITVYKDTVTIQDDDTKPDSYEYSRSPAKIQPVV